MLEYEVGQALLRMFAIFIIALAVVRLMGNRTVGQLSPFDFVIMVGIGDIITNVAMEQSKNFLIGVETLVALLLLQQLISYFSLKNMTLRKWFEGTPVILIEDGKIIKENFVKTNFNYDDLRQELHKQGVDITHLKDIQLARLESCGDFTVIKTPETEPLTKRDFEQYLKDIYDNPLSLAGEKWTKFEQYMDDVRYLAEYIKKQQNIKPN